MSDMNKLNDEALKNVTGGMAGIVDTGTDQNAVSCPAPRNWQK